MEDRIKGSPLYNEDLAPVEADRRTWAARHYAALWIGMVVCIPTYTLAAGMISQGMTWWQALLTITLGNVIVLIPIFLNAHAGTRYGIPFPVLLRSSFGTVGANIPALMRALVACGWFGIQTWIGGEAIYLLMSGILDFPRAGPEDQIPVLGLSAGQLGSFLVFWILHMVIILRGMHVVRRFEVFAAPILVIFGLILLGWAITNGGGLSRILAATTISPADGVTSEKAKSFGSLFWPNLTAMVGFWATLSLNIPDFTRFAKSQRDQVLGQAISLPLSMALFSFIGIAVSGATSLIFDEVIWDPVILLSKLDSPIVVGLGLLAIVIATLSTNLAANVVSPANDFSNVNPRQISFKRGALITGIVGILILPWRLYNDLGQYVFTWLIGYGAMLGAIAGIMIVDYYGLRRRHLSLSDLYSTAGRYGRFNRVALISLALGIAPNLPGFIANALGRADSLPGFWNEIYTHGWFVSLAVSGAAHYILSKATSPNPDR